MIRICVVLLLFASSLHFSAQSPNIIYLMADDLGWGDVGFNGNKKIITPNLDQMAKSGIRFTNFYAAAPLCSPTRASCLTGRAPFRQGIFAAHTGGLRHSEVTIAEVLKKEGYSTGFFGKWHLGWIEPEGVESRGFYSPPWHHGFDEVFATKSAVPTWNPTRSPQGWSGFGANNDGTWGGSKYIENGNVVTENLDGDDSRIIMDRAIPFIEKSLQKNTPFFATIWFHSPHEPIVAGPEYLAKYPDLPEEQKHLYGCITAMDEQIGRLRNYLKESGVDKNTILFFCSDNGPSDPQAQRGIASAGSFKGHKHQMWEGGIRVPSLIEWPMLIDEAMDCDYITCTNDYYPTILDILQIKKNNKVILDGQSLLSILEKKPFQRIKPFAVGYRRLYKGTELYALIYNSYKICIPDKGQKMMMFNLANDPGESNDISEKEPIVFKEMLELLEKEKESWRNSREGLEYIL